MATYTFDGETFNPCEQRVPWPDGMVLSEWLELAGFDPGIVAALCGGDDIEVYANQDETAFVALVAPFSNLCHVVYIDSFSALMAFIRDHARQDAIVTLAEEAIRLGNLADRAFRAWHWHGPDAVCLRCDPDEYQRLQELKTRRLARQMNRKRTEVKE